MAIYEICPISGKPMKPVFSETVLGKYLVTYYYCEESGLLKSEKPYWLDEVHQKVIADTDTGLVQRNIYYSRWLEPILHHLFNGEGKFLDVSGGYGLLTRLLRDTGFDCYTTDTYCKNIFADAFEPKDGFISDALFAFEVLEHIENPREFLGDIFKQYSCKTIIFSTITFSNAIPPRDWWYYSFESGQHITFYQPRTLSLLAEILGNHYYAISPNLHIITDIDLSRASHLLLMNNILRKSYAIYVHIRRKGMSKTRDDHLLMKEKRKL